MPALTRRTNVRRIGLGVIARKIAAVIRKIEAKTLLAHVHQPDDWFGLRYNMNLYRGCQHQCIYCDSRSACYGIENFADVLVKGNAIALLREELPRKRVKGLIGTGSMNDPYGPVERQYGLTRQALALFAEYGFPVHVLTTSDLVLRDLDLLQAGAPPPSARLAALESLARHGIETGVLLMPILPFLEDDPAAIRTIVEQAATRGARHVVPGFGVTLRDRQRDYFYARLDQHFPGLRARYEAAFGERYSCSCPDAAALQALFDDLCRKHGLRARVAPYRPEAQPTQLQLL